MLNGFNIRYPRDKQFCQYNQDILIKFLYLPMENSQSHPH